MMLNKIPHMLWLVFTSMLFIFACSHYDELERNGTVSTAGENSHNAGEDCMRCHHSSGNEASERWWNVAGTVYYSSGSIASAAGTVQLWTGPRATGKLVYSLPIDRSGNFYTEKISNFRDGYFPIIISGSDTTAMEEPVSGDNVYKSCNSCHGHNGNGLNTPRISIN